MKKDQIKGILKQNRYTDVGAAWFAVLGIIVACINKKRLVMMKLKIHTLRKCLYCLHLCMF
jgi:hypothetical protein